MTKVPPFLAFFFALIVAVAPSDLRAQNTLISTTDLRDFVFDHAGANIYLTTRYTGAVQRYEIATGTLQTIYEPRGFLDGIDIAPDDSFLLVADAFPPGYYGIFHKIDLGTGAATEITYPLCGDGYAGFDVAIVSNSVAIATVQSDCDLNAHFGSIYQVDLQSNTATRRDDAPQVPEETFIERSVDRSLLYFAGRPFQTTPDLPPGIPILTYNSTTNSFSAVTNTSRNATVGPNIAVNRNGTLLATQFGNGASIDRATDLHYLRSFGIDGSVVFDPGRDVLYGVNTSTSQIVAYDTNTFTELFRLDIGESVGHGGVWGDGMLVASPDGRYLGIKTASGIRLIDIPNPFPAPTPSPTPTLGNRRDMVFDHANQFLYVTTSDGLLERYNISAGNIDRTFNLGGSLNGVDIAPDDSFVIVAQGIPGVSEGVLQRVDLNSGTVTNITYPRVAFEDSAWDVAIASNGRAFSSGTANGSSWAPLHQIDLATNAVTVRSDTPVARDGPAALIGSGTQIHRSANSARLYFLGNPIFTYDTNSDAFGPTPQNYDADESSTAAVSHDGSLLATRINSIFSLDSAPDLHFKHSFDRASIDGGLAFDSSSDVIYALSISDNAVIAYDTNTFAEKSRVAITATMQGPTSQFGIGNLVASNGPLLALSTPTGVELLDSSTATPSPPIMPVFDYPSDFVFDHSGRYLYITTLSGFVWPYNLVTQNLETPYDLGGLLNGIDIAPNDSFILVGQHRVGVGEGMFHKLNLGTGSVTNLNYSRVWGEAGGWDVAIDWRNHAMLTTAPNSGFRAFNPLRQVDLGTNAITIRSDAPASGTDRKVLAPAELQRSADRNRLLVKEHEQTMFTYEALSDSFGPAIQVNFYPDYSTFGVNRNGSMIGVRADSASAFIDNAPSLSRRYDFQLYSVTNGIAFDSVKDIFYGIDSDHNQIVGYETNGFVKQFTIDIGEDVDWWSVEFGPGNLVASQDGRYLALLTTTALQIYDVAASAVPVPTPTPTPNPLPATATPTISPSGGTFTKKVTFKLSDATAGATIYYTTDGSDPTTSSSVYPVSKKKSKGILLKGVGTYTVKAKAVANGYSESAIATATFTIK